MGRLADQVSDLEQECDDLKEANTSLEQEVDDLEQDLETMIQQRNQLQEFRNWVELAYPVIIKDFECVKLIDEVANEHS